MGERDTKFTALRLSEQGAGIHPNNRDCYGCKLPSSYLVGKGWENTYSHRREAWDSDDHVPLVLDGADDVCSAARSTAWWRLQ